MEHSKTLYCSTTLKIKDQFWICKLIPVPRKRSEAKLGKSGWIWANLIRLGQNQNLASSKTSDLLRQFSKIPRYKRENCVIFS